MSQTPAARQAFYDALLDDDPVELFDRAPCGYLSTTPDGLIVKVNQTFLTWTGYRSEELRHLRRFVDLLAPGGRLYHETHYAPLLRLQGQAREMAFDVVTADGRRLPVLVNAVLERTPEGTPRVIRIAVFDATERRGYERELLLAKARAEQSEKQARQLARTLQEILLPPAPPSIPGLEYAAAYRPAGGGLEVGGDFYDAFEVGPDDWVVVLGDVCGKGVEAALLTALVRHTLRAVVVGLHAPSQALQVLNQVLLDHETDRFCTVVLLRLQRVARRWKATLGSAGHPPPILVRPGARPEPHGGEGPLVGVLPKARFRDHRITLRPGDGLVLYTDGVTEGRSDGELYGEERLIDCLDGADGPPEVLVERLLASVLAFQDGTPRDDVAVVAVRVPPD